MKSSRKNHNFAGEMKLISPLVASFGSLCLLGRSGVIEGRVCEVPPPCPAGQTAVHDASRPWTSNGCGTAGLSLRADGHDISPCCKLHDACYETCGIDKEFCEKEYHTCLLGYCEEHIKPEACGRSVGDIVLGTKVTGCTSFKVSQEKGCTCVDDADAPAAYHEMMTRFYKTHNPAKVEHVETLLSAGHKTPPELLYSMMKEHPYVIEHPNPRHPNRRAQRAEEL